MGGRGAFISVKDGDFTFVEGGQKYAKIGEIDGVQILIQSKGSVKAPEYSHTSERTYAIIQEGKLKVLAFYDSNHKQVKAIDFFHAHGWNKVKPHVHFNLKHDKSEPGTPPSNDDWKLINKILKGLKI